MLRTIKAVMRQNNPKLPSPIITFPPIYFYETDASRDDYEKWGGDPRYKNSPLQTIVHKFDQNWDGEKKFFGSIGKKYCNTFENLPESVKKILHECNSPKFLSCLIQNKNLVRATPS